MIPEFNPFHVVSMSGCTMVKVNNDWAESFYFATSGRWLDDREQQALATLGIVRRKRHRLAGRLAAKLAVKSCLSSAKKDDFQLDHIRIENHEQGPRSGEPFVTCIADVPLFISISHADGCSVAAATQDGAVGIDLETIEERHPSFADQAFTQNEQQTFYRQPWISHGKTACIALWWCMKEAISKYLGQGLRLPLLGIEIIEGPSERDVEIARAGEIRLFGSTITIAFCQEIQNMTEVPARIELPLLWGLSTQHALAVVRQIPWEISDDRPGAFIF